MTDPHGADSAEIERLAKEKRIAIARKKEAEDAPALSRAAWDFVRNGRRRDA